MTKEAQDGRGGMVKKRKLEGRKNIPESLPHAHLKCPLSCFSLHIGDETIRKENFQKLKLHFHKNYQKVN